jgi:choline dehydrogenase-like flavoprotein
VSDFYDYIIVGSGAAGGVLAYNLSAAGARTLLLEAGSYLDKSSYPRIEADGSAQLYWGGGMEFSQDARMAFLRGRVVGGSTVVNQALMDRFDELALDDWCDECGGIEFFNLEKLAPYYDWVEQHLALHTFQEYERNRNAELFVKGCEAEGFHWHYLRRGQSDCAFEKGNDCIGCLGGCHRGSKQSTLEAFIRKALDIGLKLQADTSVERLELQDGQVRVFCQHNGTAEEFTAAHVILSAGAFGTARLMYRSGFEDRFPALGKYFSSHPQFMFFGLYDEPVDAHKGEFQTVASKDPGFRKSGFKLENVFAGPATTAMLFSPYGVRHQELMRKYRYITCAECAVRDENAGQIKVNKKGRLVIDKPLTDQDSRRMRQGTDILKQVLAASGAKEVIESPFYFGLHLMGGCRMGLDPTKSVVDPEFHVHGLNNLYICDSSLFPNSPGINPCLTVMALARRLSVQLCGN